MQYIIYAIIYIYVLYILYMYLYIPQAKYVTRQSFPGIEMAGYGWVCEDSWWLYSVAPLGNQVVSTMTWYLTQSHYPYTEPISPRSFLIMLITWIAIDRYQFDESLVWFDHGFEPTFSHTWDPYSTDSATAPGHKIGNIYMNIYIYIYIQSIYTHNFVYTIYI